MDVYTAVRSRRSVRRFLELPVPPDLLQRVLNAALRSPSGGNLQPWRLYVVSGVVLEGLKERVRCRIATGDPGDQPPTPPYPLPLRGAYAERLDQMGARRYAAVGVDRSDQAGRARVRAGNWECWGATTALFCFVDAAMFPPQWMDAGIYLQTLMLLFRSEGVDSCPQIAWAEYHQTVAEVVRPDDGLVLACGLSIGFADPDDSPPPMPRAELGDVVTFVYPGDQ